MCVSKPMRKGIERSARSTGLGMISVLLLFFRISRVVVEAARAITWTIRLGEEEGRAKEYAERVIRPLRARVHCELFGSRASTLREFGLFAIRGGGGASFSFCSRRSSCARLPVRRTKASGRTFFRIDLMAAERCIFSLPIARARPGRVERPVAL